MKFILNENCLDMEESLKKDGHDIVSAPANRSYPDNFVQKQANDEKRTIITCNWEHFIDEKDCGEIRSAAILMRKLGGSKLEDRLKAVRGVLSTEEGKWRRALESGARLYVRLDESMPDGVEVKRAPATRRSRTEDTYPQRPSSVWRAGKSAKTAQNREPTRKRNKFER